MEPEKPSTRDGQTLFDWIALAIGVIIVATLLLATSGCTAITYTTPEGASARYLSVLQTKSIAADSTVTSATLNRSTSIRWETNSDPAIRALDLAFQAGLAAGKTAAKP